MSHRLAILAILLVVGLALAGCQDDGDLQHPTTAELGVRPAAWQPGVTPPGDPAGYVLSTPVDKSAIPCCKGIRGNIDFDPDDIIDIGDLTYLVAYMFHGGPAPRCDIEADVNRDHVIDIADLNYLVDYMFNGGPAPKDCYPLYGD